MATLLQIFPMSQFHVTVLSASWIESPVYSISYRELQLVCLLVAEEGEANILVVDANGEEGASQHVTLHQLSNQQKTIVYMEYIIILKMYLKVHKIENFFDFDFGIRVISLLVMHK